MSIKHAGAHTSGVLPRFGVMVLHSEQGWKHKRSEKGCEQDRAGKVTSGLSTVGGNNSHYIPTPKSPRIYFTPCHSTSISSNLPLYPGLLYSSSPVRDPLHSCSWNRFNGNHNTSVLSNKESTVSKEVGVLQLSHRSAPSCEHILTIFIFVTIGSMLSAHCVLGAASPLPSSSLIPTILWGRQYIYSWENPW